MNFKVSKVDKGVLYIMRFMIDGEVVHKVGLTTRKPEERLMEVLMSFYKVYRYVPLSDLKRFKTVEGVHKKEAMLLDCLGEFRYNPSKKFSGCTEMFNNLDEGVLLDMYDRCIKGEQLGKLVSAGGKDMEGTLDKRNKDE